MSRNHDALIQLFESTQPAPDSKTRRDIIEHIAAAPFSREEQTVAKWNVIGRMRMEGRSHPSRAGEVLANTTSLNSADWHAAKHSARGEWPEGTTTEQYLGDIRAISRAPKARLHVGTDEIRVGSAGTRAAKRAAVTTSMDHARATVSNLHASKLADHRMLVVYDTARKCLVTGYQLPNKDAFDTVNSWTNHREFAA